ncbi:hypothetical protein [Xanthomonas hortorum]|uniref:Uncharacterized protein n=1 Tax=Xanthomonas hortorum pv. hederae TaxID=453603 RepID=A0A9X3YYN5_9XANT|nr:hypothetical protein [Xanthomonas hortorum]MDC8637045.1 hypothetical protein [Xanthomonas hortorum pv. hederae]
MTDNFAIERLASLLRAGYEIDHAGDDAITLRHPATRSLGFVYADGLTVLPGKKGEVRFYTDSPQDEFYAFVRNIPKPGWRRSVRIPEWLVSVGVCAFVALLTGWIAS